MAEIKGRSEVRSFINGLPEKLVSRVIRGAGRAGAQVIADEIKARADSAAVADAVIIRSRTEDSRVIVRISIKPGWTYARALWLEYGTAPHFISVDESQRGGRGIGRINRQVRNADGDHSLVINGQFVGATVWHPGARAHPFMRVSLDHKEAEAIQAAQQYVNARISPAGVTGEEERDDA